MTKTNLALAMLVAATLAGRAAQADAEPVRARLAARRAQELDRLHAYAARGEFPRNLTSATPIHLFQDQDGRLCAVANLVHRDGLDALVASAAKSRNDVVLAEVTSGPLYSWALSSGLTLEELARIQAPAPYFVRSPVGPPPMVAQLRAHFAAVEKELRANNDVSLDKAVARLDAAMAPKQLAQR